jgi:hypothetical protein
MNRPAHREVLIPPGMTWDSVERPVEASFANELPPGMTWDEYDRALLNAVALASLDNWWCAGQRPGTKSVLATPTEVRKWLRRFAASSMLPCIPVGWRRLMDQHRVRYQPSTPGLPPAMPARQAELNWSLIEDHFADAIRATPPPPKIGWVAFRSVLRQAIDTLEVYNRVAGRNFPHPTHGEVVEFLVERGIDADEAVRGLPVVLGWLNSDRPPPFITGIVPWHPLLVERALAAP